MVEEEGPPSEAHAHDRPNDRPLMCPRFLSHMKAGPSDLRPPCFLISKSRPLPPSQGRRLKTHILITAPRTQALDGEAYQQTPVTFTPSQPQQEEGSASFDSPALLINTFSRLFFLSWSSGVPTAPPSWCSAAGSERPGAGETCRSFQSPASDVKAFLPGTHLSPQQGPAFTMLGFYFTDTPHKLVPKQRLIAVVGMEFRNSQLLQWGDFSLPLLANRPSQQETNIYSSSEQSYFHLNPDRRGNHVQITGRPSSVVVPSLPLPPTPPSSTINPTTPLKINLHPDFERQESRPNSVPASPSYPHLSQEEQNEHQQEERAPQPAVEESDWKLLLGPAGPELSPPPASTTSHGSLSDLSRPPSSMFSRSTNLASGRSSFLSDIRDSDSDGIFCSSPLHPRPGIKTPLASPPPAGANLCQSSTNATTTPPLYKPLFGHTTPLIPRPKSGDRPQSDKPLSRRETAKAENPHRDASIDPALHPSLESDHGLVPLTFPSATWSSCPSPQMTTPRSGSGPKLTPSPSLLESNRWPVLPPISPVRAIERRAFDEKLVPFDSLFKGMRPQQWKSGCLPRVPRLPRALAILWAMRRRRVADGRCGSAASRYSEVSCSQSHAFDELEAIAPRSISCQSLDLPSDSSCSPSPNTANYKCDFLSDSEWVVTQSVLCEIPLRRKGISTPSQRGLGFAWAASHTVTDPLLIGCDEENFGAWGGQGRRWGTEEIFQYFRLCCLPPAELSPGLAALTVGCDSGNLGSLSRVQLLLLDRPEPETLLSPFPQEEELSPWQDWSDVRMENEQGLASGGVLRPLTAGSISERCDSAGKVQENKSDGSDGGSGSPSSWIIDKSPSCNMSTPTYSPCNSIPGSDEGGPMEEESNYPGRGEQVEYSDGGRRPGSLDNRIEKIHRRMEEKKTKVLSILSKLQDETPHQQSSNKGRSNFEDFDFLAKYCIFSQEKLAEYKRAFEAEDSDGDGYLSCLQVLLALKNIIPPELLSDKEEIYVYRILEMVDFRVTDGLVDLRLFAVIASLAQKIATMDEFMRSQITNMDFRSLEVRLFKAKQLFLFLLEEQHGDAGALQGFISTEQLLLELKAGGIHLEQEEAIRLELKSTPPLDLLDFLAHLPLFMLIHKSVIANPLDDSSNL
ncbi:hypothetical protein NQZ68_013963 [Dissostichus eleginoides]|nr:hypothetical protein NQZ68_013963 [Dissostichus eleginoides]